MGSLLGLGVLVMIAADAAVGARLLLLARRTRELPELLIGASFFLLGGIGYPLAIAARSGVGGPEGAPLLLGAALGLQDVGCACMALATWRTFRPDDPRGLWGALAIALTMALGWSAQALAGFSLVPGSSASYWVGFAGRVLSFAWPAAESWRYFGMLRRRLALGLADPVVADRFRLWSLSTTAVTCGFLLFMLAAAAKVDVSSSAWVLASTSAIGFVSGVSFWLAFLPPRLYLRRFEPRAVA